MNGNGKSWFIPIVILLSIAVLLLTGWNHFRSESKNPYDQWGLGQETANKELSATEAPGADNNAVKTQWPMAPPKVEIVSDWNFYRCSGQAFDARYLKIDNKLALQIYCRGTSISFVPES